jgi:hypothetical protein
MPEKQVVFVLGMGRSGTSLVTRILSLSGATLPERLLGPDQSNPAGYWEPLTALEINEAFLARFGSSWYDPTFRLQGEVAIVDPEREIYLRQIQGFLESCPVCPSLVIKEPRITALAEFWLEAATRAGFTPIIVIPVRHPREVSASLAVRDGISPELAGLLWLKYNLLAERCSRPFRRVFVAYSKVVQDWRQEVARIAGALKLPRCEPDEAAIDQFVSADLYRQRGTGTPGGSRTQDWCHDVYVLLSAAARDEPADTNALDAIFAALTASEYAFRTALDESRGRLTV